MIHRARKSGPRRGVVAVEAAVTLPFMLVMMFGVWEVGRLIHVNQIMVDSAREGARLAAGAYVNGSPVTEPMVVQAVRDYMRAGGLPGIAHRARLLSGPRRQGRQCAGIGDG